MKKEELKEKKKHNELRIMQTTLIAFVNFNQKKSL